MANPGPQNPTLIMSARTASKEKLLVPMTTDQRANPLGMHLLHHYYTTTLSSSAGNKFKINFPVFNVNHTKDIPLIMECAAKEGLKTYGIIALTHDRHYTPILIHEDRAYIFESLGTGPAETSYKIKINPKVTKSDVGRSSATQIACAIRNAKVKFTNIITYEDIRQFDDCSCGTDAYLTLKQALSMPRSIKFFADTSTHVRLDTLQRSLILTHPEKEDSFYDGPVVVSRTLSFPPMIAKYIQDESRLAKHPMTDVPTFRTRREAETMQDYASKYFGTKNNSVSEKRQKHVDITKSMLKRAFPFELKEYVKESSGLNLILRNIDFTLDSATKKQLIDQWVTDEMQRSRGENPMDPVSKGTLLSELVTKLLPSPSKKINHAKKLEP